MTNNQTFATRHDIAATPGDVARIKGQLAAFYADVERIEPVADAYVQLHHGEAIREALAKRHDLYGAFGAAMTIAEMPATWPTKYKASVAGISRRCSVTW